MTQRAYPLNDTNYTAEDVRLFHVARCTGIFNALGNDLQVQANSGMNINVLPGYAFLLTSGTEKTGGFTYGSDAIEPLTVDVASSTDRYDYVSVRYSKTTNQAKIMYVKGSGTRPTAPIRNANEYEIILAIIHVRANSPDIKGSDIIDCRLDAKYCGVVIDGTDRLDTSGFSQEFRSYMEQIKNILDSNTAGNLLNEINAIKSNEQKPNLLLNSDFKSGIINQRGQTSYTGGTGFTPVYTVDMWMCLSQNPGDLQVTVNANSITIKNTGTREYYYSQKFNKLPLGNYTYNVHVKSITGDVFAYTVFNEQTKLKVGDNIATKFGEFKEFAMQLNAGASVEVEFMKLEKGSIYTGMPVWNEAEELAQCQRYFQKYDEMTWNVHGQANKFFALSFAFSSKMQKIPTVKNVDTSSSLFCKGIALYPSTTGCRCTCTSETDSVFSLSVKNIEFDANEY